MDELNITVTFWQALIMAIWVAFVMSRSFFGGATLTLRFSPMMSGLVAGIVFNNVHDAMMITAAIQLIYMGIFAPGGQMPSEPCIAASIAVPVAILSGLKPEAAIGVAVPVGLLGSYLYQLRFFFNTLIMQKFTDKYAEEANGNMLTMSIIIFPTIVSFVLYVPFMFVALYYGAPVIAGIIKSNSTSVIFHILSVVGGGLAAVGIAVTVYIIGKKNYIAFFLFAFFIAITFKSLNITMVTYAIFGTLIAFIYVLSKSEVIDNIGASANTNNKFNDDDDDY